MNFINHTPFPAIAFEGIDQNRQSFHVVVLRQTLSFADGELTYANTQAPLCETDTNFIEDAEGSQESDLCHFKPSCDVIVNATAYAPKGKDCTHFYVRLAVRRPDSPAPHPLRPQGLNQFEDAAPEIMARWRAQVQYAEQHPVPGVPLIDKSLHIIGPRQFKRYGLLMRSLHWIVRLGSLGILRPTPWKLTHPKIVTTLPLNDSYTFGGECRIDADDPAAKRVPTKHRMPPTSLGAQPEQSTTSARRPVLHEICHSNPYGVGFVDLTYMSATRIRTVTAPQIEHIGAKLNARIFWRMLCGRLRDSVRGEQAAFEPAGFGIRNKSHPGRRKLAGTIDRAFIDGEDALPKDFNFAFWNAAPTDQQIPFLNNDEIIELINLCSADTPGASVDHNGNTTLRLSLLRHECFTLCRRADGTMFRQALMLDTLMVKPDTHTITLVWRGVIEKNSEFPLRACEARMYSHQERDRMANDCAAIDSLAAITNTAAGVSR